MKMLTLGTQSHQKTKKLKEEETDGYSHSREFFDSLVGGNLSKKWSDLYMRGKIDTLMESMIALYSAYIYF